MAKDKKQKQVQTTRIDLNLIESDWSQVQSKRQIWVYGLLPAYASGNHYDKIYQAIKQECPYPYYYQSHHKKAFVVLRPGEQPPTLSNFEAPQLFEQWTDSQLTHFWFKALFSDFCQKNETCVSNHICYLLLKAPNTSKKGNAYATALSISWSDHTLAGTGTTRSFLLNEGVTRMKRIPSEGTTHKYWKAGKLWMIQKKLNHFMLKEVLPQEMENQHSQTELYELNTDKNFRSKIEYINISDAEAFEATRLKKLYDLQTSFLIYLQDLGISAQAHNQEMVQVHKNENKRQGLEQGLFQIQIKDGRYQKSIDFNQVQSHIFETHNQVNPDIKLEIITENKQSNAPTLVVLDYTQNAHEHYFQSQNISDYYQEFKIQNPQLPTQGLCINPNDWKFEPEETNINPASFFDYPLPDSSDKNWRRNVSIALEQLQLKELLLNPKSITGILPESDQLKNWCFIAEQHILHFSDQIQIFPLGPDISDKLKNWTGLSYEEIQLLYLESKYPYGNPSAKEEGLKSWDAKLMVSSGQIWQIKEINERPFYELEEAGERFYLREKQYFPTLRFCLPEAAKEMIGEANLEEYNALIKMRALDEPETTYNQLKTWKVNKHADQKLVSILGLKDEKKWLKALNTYSDFSLKGVKEGGLFDIAQGIWYSAESQHYFVGAKDGLNNHQDKGVIMRQILPLKGQIDADFFLSLLNVDFIRHGGFTVLPYPFALLKIWKKTQSSTVVKDK